MAARLHCPLLSLAGSTILKRESFVKLELRILTIRVSYGKDAAMDHNKRNALLTAIDVGNTTRAA